jgi:hypothetical protein
MFANGQWSTLPGARLMRSTLLGLGTPFEDLLDRYVGHDIPGVGNPYHQEQHRPCRDPYGRRSGFACEQRTCT